MSIDLAGKVAVVTGGDDPEKAADLVLNIVASDTNGKFLWIKDSLQKPSASW